MELPIVVWDTEYTSWEGCNENGWDASSGQFKEIIQIGACSINTDGEIEDTFSVYCKPKYNTELSEYIKDLIGVSQETISESHEFERCWREFSRWRDGRDAYSFGNDISVVLYNDMLYDTNIDVELHDFYDSRELLENLGFPIENHSVSGKIHEEIEHDRNIEVHNARDDATSVALAVVDYMKSN